MVVWLIDRTIMHYLPQVLLDESVARGGNYKKKTEACKAEKAVLQSKVSFPLFECCSWLEACPGPSLLF